MANELPSNVSYGTVVGRYLIAYADGSDVDLFPDGAPAKGTITFVPSIEKVRNANAVPPVTIIPRTVVTSLDSEGYLTAYAGSRGVRLVATDDTDNIPTGWTYNVVYNLTDATGARIGNIASHPISVIGGTTLDLITNAPVSEYA
jgi:hypothetical protein